MRWVVSRSRLDNAPGVLLCQCKCPPDEHNSRGRKAAKTRRAIWFIITSRSNHGSGGSEGGPLILPAQMGLRHRTDRPILQTPPPSGGGASRFHGSSPSLSSSQNKPGTIRMYALPGYLREPVFREKRK